MNIHHLELFYYVARHEGISEAVRKIPYGIQQPAVSAQIIQLETELGVSLFHRRPFCLTPAGDKLYRFIQPFFQNLDNIADEVRGNSACQVRIGAAEVVLRDHLPSLVQNVREKFPGMKLTLREGYEPDLLNWLKKGELDLALTLLDENLPPSINTTSLVKLPLILLVNKKSKITNAKDILVREKIIEPLLCLPPEETICKHFQAGLKARGIQWPPSIELSSLQLIETYVSNGYGIGLSVSVPNPVYQKNVRPLPLEGFPGVDFGVIWQGNLTPLMQTLLNEFQRRAEFVTSPSTRAAVAAPAEARAR